MLFNTHLYYKKLSEKGFSLEQAEALTDAQTAAFSEAVEKELATKRDVQRLEQKVSGDIQRLEHKITLLQWMVGLVIVAQVVPLLQKLFS